MNHQKVFIELNNYGEKVMILAKHLAYLVYHVFTKASIHPRQPAKELATQIEVNGSFLAGDLKALEDKFRSSQRKSDSPTTTSTWRNPRGDASGK